VGFCFRSFPPPPRLALDSLSLPDSGHLIQWTEQRQGHRRAGLNHRMVHLQWSQLVEIRPGVLPRVKPWKNTPFCGK
jgi:hypothetical protein